MRFALLLVLSMMLCGCSAINSFFNQTYQDDYEIVRKEGRGDRPVSRESDGLSSYLSSPQARAIEKNLGVE